MRKFNEKGFTLAELLIVVAIIAVLVAVSIPVFTTQLEKSREETDIANLRSAYAIGQTDAMTENYKVTGSDTANSSAGYVRAGSGAGAYKYYGYYDIKQGKLVTTKDTGSKGKGSATNGGGDSFESPLHYTPTTVGKDGYLAVVISETNGVASAVDVGFVGSSESFDGATISWTPS